MDYVINQRELKNDSSALTSKQSINTINLNSKHDSNNDKGGHGQSKKQAKVNTHEIDSNELQNKEINDEFSNVDNNINKESRSRIAKSSPSRNFIGLSSNNDYDAYVSYSNSYVMRNLRKTPLGPGKVGLDNLGNTCFFNSGVQCLAHMACLVNYFESSNWKSELNTQNPLGMHGEMANAFSELIHVIWKGELVSFNPIKLKSVIGQFAPQFSGNDQQDVHELITFLLDGIHEDLNRRVDKPMVDNVIGDGTNDEETAEKAWTAHKLRNDSVIVDLFHGQLRSKLNCPSCKCTTTVFDPYITLSVPLMKPKDKSSEKDTRKKLKIIYVPRDFSQRYKFFILDVQGNESIYDISDMVKLKAKTSKTVVIGRYDQASNEINWGLPMKETQKKSKKKKTIKSDNYSDEENGNNRNHTHSHTIFDGIFDDSYENGGSNNEMDENEDDDSGEYIAFEVAEADYNQYWIPCFLKMKVKGFLSSTEKNVVGPFLLPCIDEDPTEKELSDICETVISSIWEEYPDSDYENETKNRTSSQSTSDVDSELEGDIDPIIKNDKQIKATIFSKKANFDNPKQGIFSKNVFSDYNFEDNSRVKVTKDVEIFYDENFPYLANSFVTARISEESTKDPHFSLQRLLVNFDYKTSSPLSLNNPFEEERVEKISLEKCLKYFSMKEKLDDKNMWFCPHCREFVCAEKKMDVWSTPKNLIIHLKRFITQDYSFGSIESKLTTKVDYPLLLDMDPFIIGTHKESSNLYRLKAVSEHVGTTGGGHYTAVALVDENYSRSKSRNNDDESESDSEDECFKWYLFNDSEVLKVSKKEAVSNDAYVLFYERVYDDHGEKNNESATDYESKSSFDEEEEEEEESNLMDEEKEEEQSKDDDSYSSEHENENIDSMSNSNFHENDKQNTFNENFDERTTIINNEVQDEFVKIDDLILGKNNDQEDSNNESIKENDKDESNNEGINENDKDESEEEENKDHFNITNNENAVGKNDYSDNEEGGDGNSNSKEEEDRIDDIISTNDERIDQFYNDDDDDDDFNDDSSRHHLQHFVNEKQKPEVKTTKVLVKKEFTFIQESSKSEQSHVNNHYTTDDDENDNNVNGSDEDVDNSNCQIY